MLGEDSVSDKGYRRAKDIHFAEEVGDHDTYYKVNSNTKTPMTIPTAGTTSGTIQIQTITVSKTLETDSNNIQEYDECNVN